MVVVELNNTTMLRASLALLKRLYVFIIALVGALLATPPRRRGRAFIYSVSTVTGTEFPEHGSRVCMLLLRHSNGKFGPPGGLVDPGETMWQAAKRESVEETGYVFNRTYRELLKFKYGAARIYLHAVRTLPPRGLPGPLGIGREIRGLEHFSLPQLRLMLRGKMPNAPLRQAGQEALVRIVGELETLGYR